MAKTNRRVNNRKISELVYQYADGTAKAVVLMDKMHNCYRIEVRDGDRLLAIHTDYDRKTAMSNARFAVRYINRRGK